MKDYGEILVMFGTILIADGIGSIAMYWGQSALEQAVRVLRVGIGSALIILAIKGT